MDAQHVPGPVPGAEHSGYPYRWQLVSLSTSGATLKALSFKGVCLGSDPCASHGFWQLCPWAWLLTALLCLQTAAGPGAALSHVRLS